MKYTLKHKFHPVIAIALTGIGIPYSQNVLAENNLNTAHRPNILLILADDAGIGDFGFNKNPLIKTPNLDRLAAQSTRFTNFYVSPVCAPTRSSLMTGKFSEETGIYDTYNGGATMATEEVTIAEILHKNGYQTGIFGKWHLGDNYPCRPTDQGFDESFVFHGGGIGQPGDFDNFFAGDSSYFNPVIYLNNKKVKTKGYCSDVFTNEAIRFIDTHKSKPFFAYLPFNAPHAPLQLPAEYYAMYKDLTLADFNKITNNPDFKMTAKDLESAKRVYGMISNIDDNIGKLIWELEKQKLLENTVIIFLSDNGPDQNRYRIGLRGKKGMVYQGGIRTPCLWHLPGVFPENKEIGTAAAHIDVLPTILDLCGISKPANLNIDGTSLMPLLKGDTTKFRKRTLFFEWGRGYPIPYQNFAAMNSRYKLVGHTYELSGLDGFELFDMQSGTNESHNILNEKMAETQKLKRQMEEWYRKITLQPENLEVHPAIVGTKFENPVFLNRNDAKGSPAIWTLEDTFGYWDIKVAEAGQYTVKARFIKTINEAGTLYLKLDPFQYAKASSGQIDSLSIENIYLDPNNYRLEIYYRTQSGKNIFPLYTSIEKLDK